MAHLEIKSHTNPHISLAWVNLEKSMPYYSDAVWPPIWNKIIMILCTVQCNIYLHFGHSFQAACSTVLLILKIFRLL